jgi:hypothetical protein
VLLRDDNTSTQPGKLGSSDSYRPADVPANVSPQTTTVAGGDYAEALHGQHYEPAIDAAGNADCESGQNGYVDHGTVPGRYPRRSESNFNASNPNDPFYVNDAGGSHVMVQPDTPGLAGPTYTGIPTLRQLP